MARIQHAQTSDALIVAKDMHERVTTHEQANEDLLEVLRPAHTHLGHVKPIRARTERRSRPITPDERIDRQRRDRIRDEAHTSVDSLELHRLLLIHTDTTRRRQRQRIARRPQRLETDRALLRRLGALIVEDATKHETSRARS